MNNELYIERSKVREIVIGHNAATQAVLSKIDALPIFTAEDFSGVAQGAPWQPIDTKPKDHFPVLVDGPYGIFTAFQDVNWTWFARGADEPLEIEITHWMPLPARSAFTSTPGQAIENTDGGAS